MLAVGMLLGWAGYSVSLWGWCLIRGYDVTLGQLMSPTHPYGSGKGQTWPPPLMGPDVIFPGGRSGKSSSSASSSASSSSSPQASSGQRGINPGQPPSVPGK